MLCTKPRVSKNCTNYHKPPEAETVLGSSRQLVHNSQACFIVGVKFNKVILEKPHDILDLGLWMPVQF
jgi:hypothetical protein